MDIRNFDLRRSQVRKMGKFGLNQPLKYIHPFPLILTHFALFSPLQVVSKKNYSHVEKYWRGVSSLPPQVTPMIPSTPRSYKWSFSFGFLHQILDAYLFSSIISTFSAHSSSWIS